MVQSSSNNKTSAFILTLLVPFFGLIYTLNHWRESWAKNTFWLACIYFGAVLVYWPEGTILGAGSDGGRIVMRLMDWYHSSISLNDIFSGYLVDQDKMDLFQPLMIYFISRFTDNGHFLFAVYAFIFGYFYSRNIWYILEKLPNKKFGYLTILVILFFLINPITNINGGRYNTSIHIFVYALFPYLFENNKKKLWLLLVVPFVHFSFLYVSIFALVYVFLVPHRVKTTGQSFLVISLVIYIISFFINSLNLSSVNAVLEAYSPESFEERINQYVNQETATYYVDAVVSRNWYVGASGIMKNWTYGILMVLLFPCIRRNYNRGSQIYDLYIFTLLFSAFANVMALVPAGGRFLMVSQFIQVGLVLFVSMSIPKKDAFMQYLKIALVVLIIPVIVDIRRLFDYFSITAVIGNYITVLFWENNIPIITFIKMIF